MKKIFIILSVWLLYMCVLVNAQQYPADTTGMQLFILGDSLGKTYAADAAIDSIKNLGNRGNWIVQGTAANRPLFRTNVSQTGKSGIDFDGSNDNMAMPSSTALFNAFHNDTDNTIVAVFMTDNLGNTQTIFHNANITDTNIGISMYINGGGDNRLTERVARAVSLQPTILVPAPEPIPSTGIVYFAITTHSTSRSPNYLMRIDTLDRVTSEDIYTASASNASSNFTLGRATSSFDGKLLELRGYNVLKTTAQIRAIELEIISRYFNSFTPLAFATRITKPRTFFAPSGAWADSLIRAYAFTPEDSVRIDSVKDWSSQGTWAVETDAPAAGPGNYWTNELVESPGMNFGGRQDRRLLAGSFSGLGVTDKLTVVQRVRLTLLSTTTFGYSFSVYGTSTPTTSRVDFNDIDYDTDASNFLINTGTATSASMGTLGIPMQYVTIIGTYAGDSIRVYLDGVKKQAVAKTGNISIPGDAIVAIGARGTNFFIGNVLMTCIWKRVLTDEEITAIAVNPYIMFAGESARSRRKIIQ